MTTPSFSEFRNQGSHVHSLKPQTVRERILACLAVLASQQNPDGTVNGT